MNDSDFTEFQRLATTNPPIALLPENLPDNWLFKLLEEANAMQYQQPGPREQPRGLELATVTLRNARTKNGACPDNPETPLKDDMAYYANLIRLEAMQRANKRAGQAGSTPERFILDMLYLPVAITDIFLGTGPALPAFLEHMLFGTVGKTAVNIPGERKPFETTGLSEKKHILLTGEPCAGKSFLAHHLIYKSHSRPDMGRIWIMDPILQYDGITRLMDGTYTTVMDGSSPAPNPFTKVNNSEKDIPLLLPILEEMTNPGQSTTPPQKTILEKALRGAIETHGNHTTVDHIVNQLKNVLAENTRSQMDQEASALANSLADNASRDLYSGGLPTAINTPGKITTYGLDPDSNGNNTAAAFMAMLYLILKVMEENTHKPTTDLIIIDHIEACEYRERTISYMFDFYRKAAAYGACTLTVTQTIDELPLGIEERKFLKEEAAIIRLPGTYDKLTRQRRG